MSLPEGSTFFQRAADFADRKAIVDQEGAWTFDYLLRRSSDLATALLNGRYDLEDARVLLLAGPGVDFVAAWWAVWRAGGVVVPLSPSQPPAEWAYVCDDAAPELAIVEPSLVQSFQQAAGGRPVRAVSTKAYADGAASGSEPDHDRPALMLYTSGTTSKPKGVVHTHGSIRSQVTCLVKAWGWSSADRIPLVLPLNHVHGLINVVGCALWSGAICEMPGAFEPAATWNRLASGEVTLFMAVPTLYHRLIAAWQSAPADTQDTWSSGARNLRLTVSGSAALPVRVLDTWREITGHVLLERYGMTEIGMALSNPLLGERRPGFVGSPLPGVEVCLLDERGRATPDGEQGEIHVRGRSVFREYWGRREATSAAFLDGGWFRTGDVATVHEGMYRILGRKSVDIIKTGGEKVSALEIEEVLREHPALIDCAVVGVPDPEWGECVSAAVVLRPGATLELADLRTFARGFLSGPKLPRRLLTLPQLPRNAMGKVSKPQVIQLFEAP